MPKTSPERRSYRQYCAVACALDVVGGRWTLLIVRNLMLGPRRFSDLHRELPGITTNLLAKRLTEMTEAGLIQRETIAGPARTEAYALTEHGLALEPVVMSLARWGSERLVRPRRGGVSNPGWALLMLKLMYRGGLDFEIEVHVDSHVLTLDVSPSSLRVQERAASRPAAVLKAGRDTLQRLFIAGESARSLCKAGLLQVTGNDSSLKALLAALEPARAPARGAAQRTAD